MKLFCIVFFSLLFMALLCGCDVTQMTQTGELPEGYLLIDPGHGGPDGGASAQDGTKEKDINLAVSLDLYDILRVCGFPVVMTREADISIHAPDAVTIREKKVSDMHNRLALYEKADAVLSIHQNHFSSTKYSGAQSFYSPNHPDSQVFAAAVQAAIVHMVQPDNTREIKKASDDIYLLHHTQRPAVLIECGFLSNPAERQELKTPQYRQKLAFAVAAGYWNYLIK